MTVLSAAGQLNSKYLGEFKRFLMKASTTIYKDALVVADSNGLAIPAAVASGNGNVLGVCRVGVTSASSGSYYVEVQEGAFEMTGVTMAAGDLGELAYVVDDATVDNVMALNAPIAGKIIEYGSATSVWVWMSWKQNFGTPKYSFIHMSVDAADIADADVLTDFVPGFACLVVGFSSTTEVAVTTGAKGTTLGLEIGAVAVAGGSLVKTGTEALGVFQAATAITATNVLGAASTLSIVGSSTTTYSEGRFGLDIKLLVL